MSSTWNEMGSVQEKRRMSPNPVHQVKCQFCGKALSSSSTLRIHLRTHTGEKPYACDICGRRFAYNSHRDRHAEIHKGSQRKRPFACPNDGCGKSFTTRQHLDDHVRLHTGEKPFKCEICMRPFARPHQLTCHLRTHGQKPYAYDICGRKFAQRTARENHIRIRKIQTLMKTPKLEDVTWTDEEEQQPPSSDANLGNGAYEVKREVEDAELDRVQQTSESQPSFVFSPRSAIYANTRTSSEEPTTSSKVDSAEEKSVAIFDPAHLKRLLADTEKDGYCVKREVEDAEFDGAQQTEENQLSFEFSSKNVIDTTTEEPTTSNRSSSEVKPGRTSEPEHLRSSSSTYAAKCRFCGKTFSRSVNLTAHLRTHTGKKPFACDICGRRFSRNNKRNIHAETHKGSLRERPFECPHERCGKSFTLKHHLVDHVRIHTGERPYQCKTCLRSFSRPSYLTEHQKTHTSEKPFDSSTHDEHAKTHEVLQRQRLYKCTDEGCDRTFTTNGNLTAHMRSHTGGDKPFQCPTCKRRFFLARVLTEHLETHHDDKRFACDVCGRTFARSSTRNDHVVRKHEAPAEKRRLKKTAENEDVTSSDKDGQRHLSSDADKDNDGRWTWFLRLSTDEPTKLPPGFSQTSYP